VRVANELGAGNGKAAKFATKVSVVQSTIVGLFFCALTVIFRGKLSLIFSSSTEVLEAVDKLSFLLATSILLNSVQPVLSGVAVGSGWQTWVAYINVGCYYLIGLPVGIILGWIFHLGVEGIWGGMIFGGTALQTIVLAMITVHCNWEKEVTNERKSKLSSSLYIYLSASTPDLKYILWLYWQAEKATMHVQKWSSPSPNSQPSIKH
ncbi:hypothetical protein RJ640_023456, partial [Escallonia rubra]